MPYNILVIPLVGGYIFVTTYYKTKSIVDRSTGYKLLFEIIKYSIVLIIISSFLVFNLQRFLPALTKAYHSYLVPVEFPHTGKALLALAIGHTLPKLLNRAVHKKNDVFAYLDKMKNLLDNELDKLCYKALRNQKPIMLCMSNRKVYVGFITSYEISKNRHLRILPLYSGHRNESDYSISLDIDYVDVACKELSEANGETKELSAFDLEIILCADQIERASLFDKDVFEFFSVKVT